MSKIPSPAFLAIYRAEMEEPRPGMGLLYSDNLVAIPFRWPNFYQGKPDGPTWYDCWTKIGTWELKSPPLKEQDLSGVAERHNLDTRIAFSEVPSQWQADIVAYYRACIESEELNPEDPIYWV